MKIGKADLGIALYLLCAFIFLIIPMNETLLDVCLTVDMGISFAILFNAMFCKEVLDMSNFPTILLFSTMFRISLNVSSTRLILTKGDAGNVVNTFGNFVGGGDLVIGIIIYIILLIVQFMVINKGTERIAEVSA
ncbi:MAG TPA: EscV/YscV/HrcV family type III secretion system export apparatus protein, partial [Lachnospiraceae bacterium]|nr:EscV/YscV/HrcV family type III secretion system export apparatus protein [Lachnospiraceae bacterium]